LVSPNDYFVTIEDLRANEETAVPALNKKLARIGIQAEQSLMNDALTLTSAVQREAARNEPQGVGNEIKWLEDSVKDLFYATRIGEDRSDEELQKAADEINTFITENADLNFVNEASERSEDTYINEYIPYVTAPDYSDSQINEGLIEDKIKKFKRIRSELTQTIYENDPFDKRDLAVGQEIKPATVENFNGNEAELEEYNQYWDTGVLSDVTEEEKNAWDIERKKAIYDRKI
jgi:hypothetical protein